MKGNRHRLRQIFKPFGSYFGAVVVEILRVFVTRIAVVELFAKAGISVDNPVLYPFGRFSTILVLEQTSRPHV